MALLSVIRHLYFRVDVPIREIERRTGLSWNTIRKYLRADTVERGIFDNLWTPPAQGDHLVPAVEMHESTGPFTGQFLPLALMGVRCF